MYPGRHAAENQDKPAIIMASTGETVTFAEYEAGCNRLAHLLRDAGLERGDHIAVLMENHPTMLEIEGAAERVGLYYTLVNAYLAPDEVAYIVSDSRSKVFVSSVAKREVAEAAAAQCPRLERMLMVGLEAPARRWEPYEAAVAGWPATPVPDESLGAAMLYSSGTTGQPKGILRELPTVGPDDPLPVMQFVRGLFGFREGMTYLSPAPLYHSAPQASVSAALRLGSTVIVMEHFDPEQWLALVERYRVTHCQMVPVMFSRLLRLPAEVRARYVTSSLECIVHAAAPCPTHVKQAMIDWLGPIITEYYGATEANGFTFCTSAEWLAHPGTVGRTVLGELLILDAFGEECPTGTDGTVWFRGATAFEYFQDPVKTAESRSLDGTTSAVGDVGHVDADGYLYLTDRKSYMIISGGVNIYPQETENVLSGHPAVVDVAVIGVPNDDLGEEVKAVVQLADPAAAGPAGRQYGQDASPSTPARPPRSGSARSGQRSTPRMSGIRMILYLAGAVIGVVLIVLLVVHLTKNAPSTPAAGAGSTPTGSSSAPTASASKVKYTLITPVTTGTYQLNTTATTDFSQAGKTRAAAVVQQLKAHGAGTPGKSVFGVYGLNDEPESSPD
ncbi:MAG: AMP-binding protein, partial [Streptosporangiaceae bacterium]